MKDALTRVGITFSPEAGGTTGGTTAMNAHPPGKEQHGKQQESGQWGLG